MKIEWRVTFMPGIHKNTTIAFRPSAWEKQLINERAELSGIGKKNFITRACIYSSIIVTGEKENIDRIVVAIQEKNTITDIRDTFLATVITIVEILDGAAYLFHKEAPQRKTDWKKMLEREQYRNMLWKEKKKE